MIEGKVSKYIRLKNKLAKVDAEDSECYYFNKLKKFIYKDEDYKTANTIAELCDCFVLKYEDSENYIVYNDLYWAITKAHNSQTETTIYGAIWTRKGLIYVAKLKIINNAGELRLL